MAPWIQTTHCHRFLYTSPQYRGTTSTMLRNALAMARESNGRRTGRGEHINTLLPKPSIEY